LNGIIASIFLASSVLHPTYPLTNGLEARVANEQNKFFFSKVEFQKAIISSEVGISKSQNIAYGPWQPVSMISITENGGVWGGYGIQTQIQLPYQMIIGFSFLPGVYAQSKEVDLGGWLMFRSGIELERHLSELWTISICYDHRSSGDLWEYNPGMETWQIRIGLSLD
jgi:hypothetical protein